MLSPVTGTSCEHERVDPARRGGAGGDCRHRRPAGLEQEQAEEAEAARYCHADPEAREAVITREELAEALKKTRVWLVPEEQPGTAFRGFILHPHDAADDIIQAAQLARGSK